MLKHNKGIALTSLVIATVLLSTGAIGGVKGYKHYQKYKQYEYHYQQDVKKQAQQDYEPQLRPKMNVHGQYVNYTN